MLSKITFVPSFVSSPSLHIRPSVHHGRCSTKFKTVSSLVRLPTGVDMEVIPIPASTKLENHGSDRKPPVIFIHGTYHGAWCFRLFQSFFSKNGFDTYSVSLRGSGKSVVDQTDKVTIQQHVSDLSSLLPSLSLNRPPVVIAHSMGGFVAQKLVEATSVELDRLILIASVPPKGGSGIVRRTLLDHGIQRFVKIVLAFARKSMMTDIQTCREIFFSRKDTDFYMESIEGDEILEEYMSLFKQTQLALDPKSLRYTVQSRGNFEGKVLVVGGSDDWLVDVKGLRETAEFWDADLQIFEGYPHDLMLFSKWDEIATFILDWIVRNECISSGSNEEFSVV